MVVFLPKGLKYGSAVPAFIESDQIQLIHIHFDSILVFAGFMIFILVKL